MGGVVTGVDVVDADQSNFDVRNGAGVSRITGRIASVFGGRRSAVVLGGVVTSTGCKAQDHRKRQEQGKKLLFHARFLLFRIPL